jgi:hypothetical protein
LHRLTLVEGDDDAAQLACPTGRGRPTDRPEEEDSTDDEDDLDEAEDEAGGIN